MRGSLETPTGSPKKRFLSTRLAAMKSNAGLHGNIAGDMVTFPGPARVR